MNPTKIEWVRNPDGSQGYTLNPIKGKCKIACSYCYGNRMYDRFKWNPEVRFAPEVFGELESLKKPSKIFLCSTHELFGDWIPDKWIVEILDSVKIYGRKYEHTFQILTKCPERARKFEFPDNVWLGVTLTSYKDIDRIECLRFFNLRQNKIKIKFVSFEPLQSAVHPILRGINWIIIGAETGNRKDKITPKRHWIEQLIIEAREQNIPVFLKNNLKPIIGANLTQEFPKGGLGAE